MAWAASLGDPVQCYLFVVFDFALCMLVFSVEELKSNEIPIVLELEFVFT